MKKKEVKEEKPNLFDTSYLPFGFGYENDNTWLIAILMLLLLDNPKEEHQKETPIINIYLGDD